MAIIPRRDWGARYPDGFGPAPVPAQECWLHHSVTAAPDLLPPYDDDFKAIQVLEKIGHERFGGGISYTWVISPAGLIFQGHSPDRVGAHTAGRNSRARAICLLGNYETSVITPRQVVSTAWLLQYAHLMGWLKAPALNGGHRDVSQTACPGQYAYARIADINKMAAGRPILLNPEASDMELSELINFRPAVGPDGAPRNLWDADSQILSNLGAISVQLKNLAGAIGDDEAKVIAAIQALQLGQTDVQGLARALVPLLPPGTTPEAIAKAVADEQARRLADND
jgi:N-acetylmuramoyl-L-alanine amidase